VQAGIRNITEGLTAVIKAVVSFINNLREGMSPMDSFIEAIWDLVPQPVLDALVNFRDNILPGLMTAFHNIVDPIVAWVQNNVQLKDVLIVLAGVVGGVVLGAIWSVITAMAPLLLVFGAAIAIVALLRNAWENNWGGIQEKTAAVLGFIQGIIQSAFAAIQAFWAAHGADIMAKAAEIWQTIQTAISTVITTVQTIITTAFAAIQAFWQAHGAAILATATQFWNLIKGLIDGVVNQIKLIVDAFRLAFEGDWYAFGQKLFEIWENAWNTVVNFLSGLWDMVLPWLSSLWNSVKGWFTGTDWASLGRSIVQGIINGLRAMGGALSSALQGIVDAAIQRIKAMLGIASPSKVTTHYGKMIGQGLIDGMLSTVGAVGDAAGQMFGVAGMGGIRLGIGGGRGYSAGGNSQSTVVNIDARGAARGVDRDLRAMVEDVLRQYGTQADMRVRTS
jgi:phage-related protein